MRKFLFYLGLGLAAGLFVALAYNAATDDWDAYGVIRWTP